MANMSAHGENTGATNNSSQALAQTLCHRMGGTEGILKAKRTVQKLTNGDRKWICKRRQSHKEEKFTDMQHAFRNERNPTIELKSGTVSGILKQSDKWLSIADGQELGTRTRSSKEPELEAALFAWRNEQLAQDIKVRDEDLRDKARELAAAMGINTDRGTKGLSFSSGWLDRFKKRNSIKQTRYNRHGKKELEKPPELRHPSAFPQLSPQSQLHTTAASLSHSANAIAQGAALHYLPQHMAHSMAPSVNGIPSVAHVAAVAQPASVPLPQQDHTFALPQADAAIPQPPPGPGVTDEAALLSSSAQYHSSTMFHHLLSPAVGHPADAANRAIAAVPGAPVSQAAIPITHQAVAQATYAEGQVAAVQAMALPAPHDPFNQPAMGIPAPTDPSTYQTAASPIPVPSQAPDAQTLQDQVPNLCATSTV